FLLILLGGWGALIPFVGPYFDFAYTPDQEWAWTAARGWLEVLPGAATAVGGVLLLTSRNRATAMFGGWLTVLAGAWFVVGRALAGAARALAQWSHCDVRRLADRACRRVVRGRARAGGPAGSRRPGRAGRDHRHQAGV